MPEYRRVLIGGATYFFTVTLLDRRSGLPVEKVDLLRESVRKAKAARPFHIDAWVVLPDHMHCIWTLPQGDSDYSSRWRDIKVRFARGLPKTEVIGYRAQKRGERGRRGELRARSFSTLQSEHTVGWKSVSAFHHGVANNFNNYS